MKSIPLLSVLLLSACGGDLLPKVCEFDPDRFEVGDCHISRGEGRPTSQQPKPGDPKPNDPKPEQPKPEQPKPEQPKPEQPKPEQPKPEQPKPEQPKPEQPKPGHGHGDENHEHSGPPGQEGRP